MLLGIGFSEIVVIVVVALVFIGPKKLPELMQQAGRMFVHMRRMSFELKHTFDEVISEAQKQIDLEALANMKEAKPKTKVSDSTSFDPENSISLKKESSAVTFTAPEAPQSSASGYPKEANHHQENSGA